MKGFIIRVISVLLFTSFSSILLWHFFTHRYSALSHPDKVSQIHTNSNNAAASNSRNVKPNPAKNKNDVHTDKLLERYSTSWEKHENDFQTYRSSLNSKFDAISNAVVTQVNSPVGTIITYDAAKKNLTVTSTLFDIFPKNSPFEKAPWDSCAVVGNGGILANSSCGKQIDSAAYVIRCNLPPVSNGYERDTGSKTNLVTANPSILVKKYQSLVQRRRKFIEDMQLYRDSLLLLPAFSYPQNTAVSIRAVYSLEDFDMHGLQAVFSNPKYLKNLSKFWRGQGIRSVRLSTGIMMVSLALELCNNIYLYGFWPFGKHPYTKEQLHNHYYDNIPVKKGIHAMPSEFEALLTLHNKGVIHLQLGDCKN